MSYRAVLRFALTALLIIGIGCGAIYRAPEAYAQASGDQLRFIRDAEIENYLRELATPIYRAADIAPDNVSINIVNSSVVNAFVADGMNEFFYTGLLQMADSPEQLAGVIAHETGHIAGGHLIRGREAMRNASSEVILSTILAIAAGVLSKNGQTAAGAISGGQQIAERSLLRYSRTQEASADAAGMSFLDHARISTLGMMEFFQKLAGQELLPADRRAEYVRTHPLTQDRIDAVRQHFETSQHKDDMLDQKFITMHERMRAKLLGFLQPETALLRYTDKDPRIAARYARAIALYKTSKVDKALSLTNALIKEEPENPFFIELKGQILLENGRVKEAIACYAKANELLPHSALLRTSYGHALLETRDNAQLDLAITQLEHANRLEERIPYVWHLLASAWGRKAEITRDPRFAGMASYALAEESVAKGADKAAGQLADKALKNLPKDSSYWLRAQDIKMTTMPEGDNASDKGKKEHDKKHVFHNH